MNGTPSNMCGIVLANGRDCPGWVNPDHSLNLCAEHIEAAFELYRRTGEVAAPSNQFPCPVCDSALYPGVTGAMCGRCAYKTDDFTGKIVVSYAEAEAQQNQRRAAIKSPNLVYYIRFADRIKIGTTSDIRRRMTAIPHDKLLATEPGDRHLEAIRHREFKHLRLTGEWFRAAPELLKHIASLQ